MKKFASLFAACMITLMLTGCGGGNVSHVRVESWEPSEIYTDQDISAAIRTVKTYFYKEFDGCTLTDIRYAGDSADLFSQWARQYHADQAIVLISSFDVDSHGGNGTLNPNTTYPNWNWILVRSEGGAWQHADHGF